MREPPYQTDRTPPPQESIISLRARMLFLIGFILAVAVAVTFTPEVAKRIAYSWNIGVERARAEIARELLAEHPLAVQRTVFVARAAAPSVVGIQVGTISGRSIRITEMGSGVIIDAQEGYILTNHHVVENADHIRVLLSDGREIEAEVIGGDRALDLAVLRIEADDLIALPWGDSQQVSVGEQVVAIGSPYGFQQTVTAGIISATGRLPPLGANRTARSLPQELLQTDAAINPGNSGGPLVDMNGKLIGINTMVITSEGGGRSGIGFAIPSYTAERVFREIITLGAVQHGWLGVLLGDVTPFDARRMNQRRPMGAVVTYLARGNTPAREAGLEEGDIVVRWEETEVENSLHLIHLTALTTPGTVVTVEIFRDGEFMNLEITIGTRPRGF